MKKIYQFILIGVCLLFQLAAWAQPLRLKTIPGKEGNSLRFMTYNIRKGLDINGVTRYKEIVDLILKINPDAIAIQEVDSATQRSNKIDVLKELGEQCMMYRTFVPLFDVEGGKQGLGVLSKERPLSYHSIVLPGREEARGVLLVEFENYVFCCTQLSKNEEDRVASVPLIFDFIKDVKKPLFLAGDMNCDFLSRSQNAIQSKFRILNNYKEVTIPVINEPNIPYACIDFIYGYSVNYKYAVLDRQVIPVSFSDHYPVYVDVRISTPTDEIFRTKPYLQKAVDKGITICWMTNVPTKSWVEYGKDGKLDQKKYLYVDGQMLCNNTNHHFRLTDLEPGTTYSYRVCSEEILSYGAYSKDFGYTACSDVYTFKLPEENKKDFTVLFFNDMHNNIDLMERFSDLIKKQKLEYDFVIYNGDCIDAPKNEASAVDVLKQLIDIASGETKPFILMRGNHEIRGAYSIGMRSLFDYINGTTYGSFNMGDTRFVMLDCGEDKPDSTWVYYGLNDFNQFREDQASFLRKELASQDFKQAKRRILVHHVPIYAGRKGSYNPCFEKWSDILANAPFDICINAHWHRFSYYPKKEVGNNFPIIVGGGSRLSDAYMLVLQKQGSKLTFRAIDVEGKEKLKLDL